MATWYIKICQVAHTCAICVNYPAQLETSSVEAENFVSQIWVPETVGSQWCNRLRRTKRVLWPVLFWGKGERAKEGGDVRG
jgi:hypothetical protein